MQKIFQSTLRTNNKTRLAIATSSLALGGAASAYWMSRRQHYHNSNLLLSAQDKQGEEQEQLTAALDPTKFTPFPLQHIDQLTHNVKRYRFALPSEHHVTGLTVASCLLVMANIDGKAEIRPYTPTSTPEEKGYFDLMIKVYPTGKMSQHIDHLKVGDCLLVKGPLLKFKYEPNSKKELGLIAGGTGFTPMYQLIRKVLDNPDDKTKISMIYANVTPDDIMLKSELDRLQSEHPERLQVHYTVDRVLDGQSWNQDVGYVTADMITKYLPNATNGEDVWLGVCGPPPFMKLLSGEKPKPTEQGELSGLLKNLGYTEKNVFKF